METKAKTTIETAQELFASGSYREAKICALAAHYKAFYEEDFATMVEAHNLIEEIKKEDTKLRGIERGSFAFVQEE